MRLGRLYIAAIVFCLLGTADAAACSCWKRSFEDHFRGSDLIFDGVAISTRKLEPEEGRGSDGSLFNLVTTFRVTRAIKGVGPETRKIRHHTAPSACGIGFKIGDTYQVYASRTGKAFYIGSCSRTGDLRRTQFLRGLGPRSRPDPAKTLEGVIRQIRDPKLEPIDAELLFYDFQRREKEKEAAEFIRNYIRRAEAAREKATEGLIHDGALRAAKFYEYWNDHERAAEMYALAEKLVSRDARFPTARGRALYRAGRAADAIPHLERALRLDADHPDAAVYLVRARLLSKGRTTRGIFDYRNVNAPVVTLDRARRPGIDLTGARVTRMSAHGARLSGAKLSDADMGRADFREADLSGAFFVGAEMPYGNFARADLRNAYAVEAQFSRSRFTHADLRGFEASRSWFDHADLRRARLEGAQFTGSDFTRARLEGTRLRNADFSGASLTNVTMQGADLRGGKFERTDFAGARINCKTRLPNDLDVRETGLIPVPTECNGSPQNRDFSGREWEGGDFSGLDLAGASFTGAKFSHSALTKADFTHASLQNADFSETSGTALFYGADLSGADFSDAALRASFEGRTVRDGPAFAPARLRGTRFTGARLKSEALIGQLPWQGPPQRPDYTKATFEKAHLQCSFGDSAEYIESEAKKPLKPADPSEAYGGFWEHLSRIERREARKREKEGHLREVRQRRLQAAHIEAERRLVAFLREKWPSVTFDESCRYYLNLPDESGAD